MGDQRETGLAGHHDLADARSASAVRAAGPRSAPGCAGCRQREHPHVALPGGDHGQRGGQGDGPVLVQTQPAVGVDHVVGHVVALHHGHRLGRPSAAC